MLRLRPAHAAVPLLISALLAGCGGGGGGGGGGDSTNPATSPALTFTPSTVNATFAAGTSLTTNVIAAVARPGDFNNATVFAVVVDANSVLQPNVQLVRDSETQYHAVLQTSPTLAAGSYTGSFSVRLCRDSGCASQFPGSPVALPYNITVTPAGSAALTAVPALPLTATAQSGASAPASVAVAISGRNWSASSGASWLKLSATSGAGDASLSASYDLTGLAPGDYTTELTISAADNQRVVLPVKLTVLPPGLVLGSNSVTFNAINGAPVASQIVGLDTDDKVATPWVAGSNTPWLSVSPTTGSTPATTVLTVTPTIGTLASGSYSGSISIQASGRPLRTLPVTLNLTPATLLSSPSTIALGGIYGRDFSASLPLTLSLNTSTNSWPWQLTNLPAWASTTTTSGTINSAGASLSVKAIPAAAVAGVRSQLASVSAQVNGDTVSSQVLFSINKDLHKLLPAETAVAFVSTPSTSWSRLNRTISVSDNFGSFAGMSATSDAAWLVVAVSGDKLTLEADPSQMLSDTVSTATITITPSDPDAVAPETIRVSLWKASATPSPLTATRTALPYTNVVTDPARPYAYVHNGGAYIDVYNVYTGLKEASITGFSATLGDMAISPNGDELYVVDINNARVTTVNLNSRTIRSQLPLSVAGTKDTRIKLIRPNGVGMLVLSDGQIYLTDSNTRLSNLPLNGGSLGASSDGKRLLQQNEGGSSVLHTTVSVDYAALNNGTLFAAKVPLASHTSPGTLGQDVSLSSDGKRVFSASSTPKSCTIMSATDLGIMGYLSIGDAVPNNIDVGLDGRIFCGGAAKSGSSDIYMYDSTGAKVLQQYKLSTTGRPLLPRQMAVSGDGWILVGITDDGVVTFQPVGP